MSGNRRARNEKARGFDRRRFLGMSAVAGVSALAASSAAVGAPVAHPHVLTTGGVVRGRSEGDVAVFRGIPFAAAPVGELRFQAPVAHPGWPGVRDAGQFGPPPPPVAASVQNVAANAGAAGDEWLTVNVWSPDLRARGLPVLVWIYGGAWSGGAASLPGYDGRRLAERGAVVVGINYRVGAEGFLQLAGAPANRGLLDQVAGLRWVRDNIAAFGGDPRRVTVFGQSAGAGSIACLLAMPSAAGLFHGAICQSVPLSSQRPELARDIADVLTARLGRRATAAELRDLPPAALGAGVWAAARDGAANRLRWGPGVAVTVFHPVVDGVVLPEAPHHALARGVSREVPLIVGHTRDEYRVYLAGATRIAAARTDELLRQLAPVPDGARAYRAAYPGVGDGQLYEIVQSDFYYRMPSLFLARAHARGGGTSYLYEFRYGRPASGAGHGAEVPLVFGTGRPDPGTSALGEQLRDAWISFAANGSPGWVSYGPESEQTRLFDIVSGTGRYPEQASARIWANHPFDPVAAPA
ncbi:carboxylesterase/lipase family protein [Nocardia sp. alder85J]|uniref:carboxylesterase/lipase family protein n=1 Tax=Nocardia sp. alder85J TaxID=2862949 RepID=UPI001CD67458|nr:carboxylesterase family protein [Nocardia sp. alder85J]MCX4090773.1 carboxylesterase family protein [Nocardia sp. alder85J]